MDGLTRDEMPADVAAVLDICTAFTREGEEYFVVADADLAGLREGAYSLALEGGPEDWPWLLTEAVSEGRYAAPTGWHLEARNGWSLAMYPMG